MLKRKIFAVALPLVAGATIVGSGFAAWVFGTNTGATKGINMNISVTDSIDLTNVSLKTQIKLEGEQPTDYTNQPLTIELDQGSRTVNPAIGENERGISIKSGNKIVESIQVYVHSKDDSLVNMKKAGFVVSLSTTVTFDSTLLNYLDVKAPTSWLKNAGTVTPTTENGTTYTAAEQELDIGTQESDNKEYYVKGAVADPESGKKLLVKTKSTKDDQVTHGDFYHTNEIFKWEDSKKPADPDGKNKVDQMRTALSKVTDGVKINFELKITDPNA